MEKRLRFPINSFWNDGWKKPQHFGVSILNGAAKQHDGLSFKDSLVIFLV